MDLRPSFTAAVDAFSVPVVVTLPNGLPITTKGIWLPTTTEDVPFAAGYQRRDQKRVIAISKDGVPVLAKGSRIKAPEKEGGPIKRWLVDAHEFSDDDHHRVVVVEVSF